MSLIRREKRKNHLKVMQWLHSSRESTLNQLAPAKLSGNCRNARRAVTELLENTGGAVAFTKTSNKTRAIWVLEMVTEWTDVWPVTTSEE
jgi:hypothetical protein